MLIGLSHRGLGVNAELGSMGTLAGSIALGVCLLVVVRMLWSLMVTLVKGVAVFTFGAIVLTAAYRSGFLSEGMEGVRSIISNFTAPSEGTRTAALSSDAGFQTREWQETVANLVRLGLKKSTGS